MEGRHVATRIYLFEVSTKEVYVLKNELAKSKSSSSLITWVFEECKKKPPHHSSSRKMKEFLKGSEKSCFSIKCRFTTPQHAEKLGLIGWFANCYVSVACYSVYSIVNDATQFQEMRKNENLLLRRTLDVSILHISPLLIKNTENINT